MCVGQIELSCMDMILDDAMVHIFTVCIWYFKTRRSKMSSKQIHWGRTQLLVGINIMDNLKVPGLCHDLISSRS